MSRSQQRHDTSVFTPLPVAAPSHPTSNLSGWELAWSGGAGSSSAQRESINGVPVVPAVWDPSRPFAFARRTLKMDWERVLSLDLASIVAQRDLSTLQSLTQQLVFADLTQDDLEYFESDALVQSAGESGKGNGVANSLHLFRLWQLTGEALLHVQGFLMRSLQAKEGAAAVVREKYAAKVEAERAANTVLKARLGAAQAELKQARAAIAGYERAGARGLPVYLPQSSQQQQHQGTAQYPGEVFACAVCSHAFTTAHYLAQHYQRRHPEFAPLGQQHHHTLSKHPQEEKEPTPAPYQPKFDANALAALRAELTASLSAQLDAQWARRRQEEHHRLLARLSALESLLASQFADQTIPASMEASQRRIYEAILREVESIKMELAREGGDFTMPPPIGTPHWSIQQQQPSQRPATPVRTPKQAPLNVQAPGAAASFALDEPAARPAPLAVMSPTNSNPAYSVTPRAVTPAASRPRTPPPPAIDPSSLYHLPRADRIRSALLARDGYGSYAPFPELPWLQSRYGAQDWNPPALVQLEALARRVDEIAEAGQEHRLAELEDEMHAQDTAAESYNSCHHTVEDRCASYMPTPQWMLDADAALDAREEFLPHWAKLIADKEARERQHAEMLAAQQAELEHLQTLERDAAERAAAIARSQEAESQARAATMAAQISEQDRRVAEQRRMLIQHEFTEALKLQQQQQAASLRAQTMTPTPPTATGGKEGLPPLDTGASPSHASGLQRHPSQSQSQSSIMAGGLPMGGQTIMSRSASGTSDAAGLDSMRSPLSRPEGFDDSATIMPRTPNAKTAVPMLTPSMRQQLQQQSQQQQQHAQLGPSPSASFSSNAGSSFGSSMGSENNSFGGASIMQRNGSGLGGLTHISEGASIDDSMMQSQSRRGSVELEGKYAETSAVVAPPSPVPVIPRTHLDEEFEQMLSPKRVAPRTTAPPIVVGGASPQAAQRFMAASNATTAASPQAQPYSSNTTAMPQQVPPPVHEQLSDRASHQQHPGAFAYGPGGVAQTPGPGWTPAPAPTPQPGAVAGHTYSIGGHGFSFPQQTPSYAASSGIAEGVEALDDSDEFPLSNDAQASQAEHRASIAEAQRLQAEQDRRQRETEQARREEAEAFGVPSVLHRSQQQQPPQSTFASSGSQFNDSLDVMELAPEPQRTQQQQPSRPVASNQLLGVDTAAASRVSTVAQVGELTPAVPEVTPSPGGVIYQQRNSAPVASAAAFLAPSAAASRETVQPFTPSASINAVQAFSASPSASPAASHAYGQQSFQQSQPAPAPATVSAPASSAAPSAAALNRSTFLSDFSEDDFAVMDEIASARPAAAATSSAAPSSSAPSRPQQQPPSRSMAVDDADEFADVVDSDDDAEIYGRNAASSGAATASKPGTAVIAQGSVSNARAKLVSCHSS